MAEEFEKYVPLAQKFVDFVNQSVTAYHAVETAKNQLLKEGFVALNEKESWSIKPKGKYFFTRNQSTLVAFVAGGKFVPGNGFSIIGAHTDSPHLNIKPRMAIEKEGYVQVAVEPYGGGLWPTWFDRDLTIAGRVIVKKDNLLESRLVKVDRPILRIPTLAIHLNRESSDKLEFNKQSHLLPVLATSVKSQLEEKFGGTAKNIEADYWPPKVPSSDYLLPNEDASKVLVSKEEYQTLQKDGKLEKYQVCRQLLE